MRMCVRAHIRVGKGDRRAKLFISLEPKRTSKCFRRFEQGSTKQTENMYVSPVLSELLRHLPVPADKSNLSGCQ